MIIGVSEEARMKWRGKATFGDVWLRLSDFSCAGVIWLPEQPDDCWR